MPRYDFRCKRCQKRFDVSFRAYEEYDRASPICPHCGSAELTRLISQVAIAGLKRDYRNMSSGEMLSVLESGDRAQVDDMFRQVGGEGAAPGAADKRSSKREG